MFRGSPRREKTSINAGRCEAMWAHPGVWHEGRDLGSPILGANRIGMERSSSSVRSLDVLHVPLTKPLHQPSRSSVGYPRHQSMDWVGHEDVGVDANRLALRERCQGARQHPIIALAEDGRGLIDASLNNVHGEAGGHTAAVSGHRDRSSSRKNRWPGDGGNPWSVPNGTNLRKNSFKNGLF